MKKDTIQYQIYQYHLTLDCFSKLSNLTRFPANVKLSDNVDKWCKWSFCEVFLNYEVVLLYRLPSSTRSVASTRHHNIVCASHTFQVHPTPKNGLLCPQLSREGQPHYPHCNQSCGNRNITTIEWINEKMLISNTNHVQINGNENKKWNILCDYQVFTRLN